MKKVILSIVALSACVAANTKSFKAYYQHSKFPNLTLNVVEDRCYMKSDISGWEPLTDKVCTKLKRALKNRSHIEGYDLVFEKENNR